MLPGAVVGITLGYCSPLGIRLRRGTRVGMDIDPPFGAQQLWKSRHAPLQGDQRQGWVGASTQLCSD